MILADDEIPPYEAPGELLSLDQLRCLPECHDIRYRRSGVYFLWDEDVLVYIGRSKHVPFRISQHTDMYFTRHTFLEARNEYTRYDLEAAYIRKYLPPFNRQVR